MERRRTVVATKHKDSFSPNELAQRGRELDQLCRFSSTLGTTLDVDTLVHDCLDSLLAMAQAERVLIALAADDARVLIPVTSRGWDIPKPDKGIPAPFIAALGTEALGFEAVSELPEPLRSKIGKVPGPFSIIPLWAHAHLRGVAVLIRAEDPFRPSTLKLLTAAGRQFALAVENSQLLADLQQSYRKLMDAQEELIRSERLAALGQLSATMAHEIRNPLATIFSALSQIRKHSGPDEMSSTLLDIAEEEATRLNLMVTGLLDFARPRRPAFERRRITEVVEEIVSTAQEDPDLGEGVSITMESDAPQLAVSIDPELVQRAVSLVVSNAVDAVEGEGSVEIRVKGLPDAPAGVLVEVRDDGVGIPAEVRSKVCDPFFSTKPSGNGLGLPTVKRIVEDHHGVLEIRSKQGTGTTVRMFFRTKDTSATGSN